MNHCYLCNAETSVAFKKNACAFTKCPDCGLYSLNLDEPYDKFLKRYYDEGYFTGDPDRCAYADYWGDRRLIQKNMKVYLKEILRHKTSGRILDVGCSLGLFLELAQAHFEPFGIDVSDYAAAFAQKQFGDRIQKTELSKVSFPKGYFDVITFFDVIEHFQDPRQELKKARRFLKDDGILLIETGNLESLWARLAGKHWHFFAPPQHLFIFGLSHLETLLSQAGFVIVHSSPHNKWLSWRYLFHLAANIGRLPGASRLTHRLRRHPLGKLGVYLPLFDKIIVTARKESLSA
jgi:2-polyprenyl-3-methyl-5-hydroxy-6-metoxy-1,4-benzoquinol methylase